MATHSGILAWKIPWTEEPGGLQSMGSDPTEHLTLSLSFLGGPVVRTQYFHSKGHHSY